MPEFERMFQWDDDDTMTSLLGGAIHSPAFMVGHKGVPIVLTRGSTVLDAQTVVIVPASGSRSTTPETPGSSAGLGGQDYVYLVGTRGHAEIADFNVARGDLFTYQGVKHRITYVDKTMAGKTEARAVATQ